MKVERPEPLQHIPPEAEKVFSGILYDAYQWDQKLFDGSTAKYERLRRADSAVILPVTRQGAILMLRERQAGTGEYLTLPAGQLDPGEEPLAAAQRELSEETGYESTDWELLNAIQIDGRVDWAVYTFIARGCRKVDEQHLDSGEQIEVFELTFEEFLQTVVKPEFRVYHMLKEVAAALLSPQATADFKKKLGL